ncbi:transcriptional regulator [Candidatus Bathyarchaeota archaeon ex4484_205]|nr:MAG: transcriptional regulator [Candidatus Bathyarchaeota archaeon ex4484_205]RLF88532.1 MAG: transcriptional regulator [Thermococci archaeon]
MRSELKRRKISVRISKSLLEELDKLVEKGIYKSRQEALMHALKELLESELGEEV